MGHPSPQVTFWSVLGAIETVVPLLSLYLAVPSSELPRIVQSPIAISVSACSEEKAGMVALAVWLFPTIVTGRLPSGLMAPT